jgi:hypothetical protein
MVAQDQWAKLSRQTGAGVLVRSLIQRLNERHTKISDFLWSLDDSYTGTLKLEQLSTGFTNLGIAFTQDALNDVVSLLDDDGSGDIDYVELATMLHTFELQSQKLERVQSSKANPPPKNCDVIAMIAPPIQESRLEPERVEPQESYFNHGDLAERSSAGSVRRPFHFPLVWFMSSQPCAPFTSV